MNNQKAAVSRRLSDPDFQGTLVNRCLALTLGMGALLAVSLIHDAYVWLNPVEPRYFFVDGKHLPKPVVALDSPIVDDTELLDWTVKAVLAPYNVDYFNYPTELNTASRRFTVRGWNTFAQSFVNQGNFEELKRARLLCHAQSQRAAEMLSPRSRNSCTSHGVIGPVSIPMLASSPACPRTARSICFGSVRHWPRQSLRPASSTTQIDVSFCETSKPTNRAIGQPPCVNRRATAPGPRHYEWFWLPTAITRCPHMHQRRSAVQRRHAKPDR